MSPHPHAPVNLDLQTLEIGTPVHSGGLSMFPLLRDSAAASYRLLDEALDRGLAEITEISDGGSVPELYFRNRSDRDILLVDGEELVGAKQNRVLNLTVLVAAGQELKIPVSCVEAGRWSWQSRRFAAGKRKLHARARLAKMRGVSSSLREGGVHARGDIQSEVWREVSAKMAAFECRSSTDSLHEVYESQEAGLRPLRESFVAQSGQVGAAFAINGRLVGVELFDSADTLARLLPKLVDSYAFDAIEPDRAAGDRATPPTLEDVRRLLDRIAQAPAATYAAVAKGIDLRVDQAELHAAALVDGDRVVHLSAFDTSGAGDRSDD